MIDPIPPLPLSASGSAPASSRDVRGEDQRNDRSPLAAAGAFTAALLLGSAPRASAPPPAWTSLAPDPPPPAPTPKAELVFSGWRRVKLGAGGYVTGIDIASDGTKVVRCDSSGAYIWEGDAWRSLTTVDSMPKDSWGRAAGGGTCIYEVAIAPSRTDRIYLAYIGQLFRSDDRGRTFTKTALSTLEGAGNDDFKTFGRKIAVHPTNPDLVVAGSQGGPLRVTRDGGASWAIVPTVPAGKTPAGMRVAFDPSGARVYVASHGNGVYVASGDATVFQPTPGGPAEVRHMACDRHGRLFATRSDGALMCFANGAWTQTACPGGMKTVAVNPSIDGHVVAATAGGSITQSFDGGATWTGVYNIDNPAGSGRRVANGDVAWLAWANETYMSSGDMCFDPTQKNRLYFAEGIGVWWCDPPRDYVGFDWHAQSRGIEQLTSSRILCPPGGAPLYLGWDRPIFRIDDPESYPTFHGPDRENSIVVCWNADYANDDSAFVAALVNWNGVEKSCTSRDGGGTWRPMGSMPAEIVTGNKIGGTIAVSSSANFAVLGSNNPSGPWFTKDGGQTWQPSVVPGATPDGWGWAYYFHRHVLVADKTMAGAFYLYNYKTGVYRSVDGAATFAKVHDAAIAEWTTYHARLMAVPGHPGHLFFTPGPQQGTQEAPVALVRSRDGGASWDRVKDFWEVEDVGFGAPAPGASYPSIYAIGFYKHDYGVWRSDDDGKAWKKLAADPLDVGDQIISIAGDPDRHGRVYVAFGGSGAAYGQFA